MSHGKDLTVLVFASGEALQQLGNHLLVGFIQCSVNLIHEE